MDIKMPKLGESVHEGTIEQWLISVGDYVDEYEPLCEVITDKVTAEVPSTVSGTITEILVSEGETVQIDHVICKIETSETDNSTNTKNTDIETVKDSTDLNINGNDTLTVETSASASKILLIKVSHSVKSNAHTQASLLNNGRYSPVVLKLHLKMILIYHQFLARVSKDV